MNGRRFTTWWLSLIALTLLAMGAMQAQETPIKLYAAKIEMSGSVRLVWMPLVNTAITKYSLYRAEGVDTSKAVWILDTKDLSATDMLPRTFVAVSKYSYFIVGETAAGVRLKSNVVQVELSGIPAIGSFKLEAKVDEVNALVQLNWYKPPVDTVLKYYVYRYGGVMSSIQLIDSTTGLTETDKPPLGGFGTMGSGMMGDDDHTDAGKYAFTYFVRAKLQNGSLLQSTSALVYFTITVKRDTVTFLTTPVTTAQSNVAYTAKVLARSSDPAAKIAYMLDKYPAGMTLDLSGAAPLLKWTPKAKGTYPVRLIARSSMNGEARQEYSISVAGSNGIVYGKVTDTTGTKPLAKVLIQIMQRDRDSHFNYSTVTDDFGAYRFSKLDSGSYILQAIPTTSEYVGQWWEGKYNADNADIIPVVDSSRNPAGRQANFKLRGRSVDSTKFIIVKGSVRDTLLLPVNVKGTQITFVRAEFALNSSTSATDVTIDNFKKFFDYDKSMDFRIEGGSKYTFRGPIDSLGNYALKIPQGTYIALARAPGYAAEFYKEHSDLLSADIMKLNADSANINFTLAPLPAIPLSTMKGAVLDTVKDIGVRARIIAFRDTWNMRDGFKMAKAYFTDTDSLGAYAFTELLPGSYIVMAMPLGNYAPAYYTGGIMDTTKWWKVSKVVVDSGKSISGIDIVVKEISSTKGGFTWITGMVKERMNGKMFGLAGALVFAHDANNEPAGYGVSDNDGKYAILGIAPGSYTVSVNKPGYTWSETPVVASPTYNTASTGLNVVASSASFELTAINSPTAVETQTSVVVPSGFTVGQNYPNPFNPSTKFQITLPAAQLVKVKVFDLLGREVATLVNRQMTAGSYTIEWNAASVPTGVYFYRVEAGSSIAVKKMILLK